MWTYSAKNATRGARNLSANFLTYDEKANKVTIKVVSCSPEKIRDKLCKGGGCIKSIEIVKPKPPPPPPTPPPPPPPPPLYFLVDAMDYTMSKM
ncbi:hypothetical protein SLEP1_g40414 [Rubroshorea leprosula]|uniref:Uncharacterized protein n=1 Tax=Rubroshorea leprosula TaxID=152421 RepID=A0AAV5L3H6_9ROSI|nr:hypothetical protein SLEP1_g40414 [Rubroshorea leprosula]